MGGDHFSAIAGVAGTLCCVGAFDCNRHFDKFGGILAWVFLMLYMFKALGTICDEYFVPSLEVIVEKLQLSNDVAGATFMAAGSSAPELFTSLVATFLIVNEGGVGTIIGSAIFNILVIVGATGLIACKEQSLKIWWYPLCRDTFFYMLSIVELIVVLSDNEVKWYEGVTMFCTYLLYCVYMKFNPHIIERLGIVDPSAESMVSTAVETDSPIQVLEAKETAKETQAVSTTTTATNGTTQSEETALRSLGSGEAVEDTRQPECGGTETPGTVIEVDGAAEECKDVKDKDRQDVKEDLVPRRLNEDANGEPSDSTVVKIRASSKEPIRESQNGLLLHPVDGAERKRRPSWGYAGMEQEARKPSKQSQGSNGQGAPGSTPVAASAENPPLPLCEGPEEEEEERKGWIRDPLNVLWELSMPIPERWGGGLLFTLSIFYIGICTYFMVDATNRTGVILHIPALAMARVFLAAGTSIPDALGSIAVAKQGEGDMAVANALGSNVFDILVGLGVPWTIKTLFLQKEVIFLAGDGEGKFRELRWDFCCLIACLLIFVLSLVVHKWHLTKRVGILLLGMYGLFLIYNIFAIWIIDPPLVTETPADNCVPI